MGFVEQGKCRSSPWNFLYQIYNNFFEHAILVGEVIQAVCTLYIALKRGDSMFSLVIVFYYHSLTSTLEIMLDAHK